MPTKESIKRELDFAKNMAEILDVMKQLAQSQFTQAKKVCISTFNAHLVAFHPIFDALINFKDPNPFIHAESKRIGIIVTCSDQAFMGALNSKLVKAAKTLVAKVPKADIEFMVTGRKGARKFKFNNEPFTGFAAIKEGPRLKVLSKEVTKHCIGLVKEKQIGRLYMVSAFSKTFTTLEVRATQLLPFEEVIKKEKLIAIKKNPKTIIPESELMRMTEYTANLWLYNSCAFLFQNNKPAEYGALATQMEGSHENVKKVISKLNIAYKRARNDKIDAGMREIFVSTMVAAG
jgi:ATP synthase F1 gamma subunit